MKTAYFIVIILIISALLYFFLLPSKSDKTVPNREYRVLKPVKSNNESKISKTFRLLTVKDSLLILTEEGYFITDKELNLLNHIQLPDSNGFVYYYNADDTSKQIYNVDQRSISFITNHERKTKKIDAITGNVIYLENGFLFDMIKNTDEMDQISIKLWNVQTDSIKTIVDLSKTFEKELPQDRKCLSMILEGNFFRIDSNSWGYIFYEGGYFLKGTKKDYTVARTLDKRPFKKYEMREVAMGGQKAYVCKAENNSLYNYAAASDGNKIFILSGIIDGRKGLHTPIDVYDAKTLTYNYTLEAPLPSKEDYALTMSLIGHRLYLFYKKSGVMMFDLSGKVEK